MLNLMLPKAHWWDAVSSLVRSFGKLLSRFSSWCALDYCFDEGHSRLAGCLETHVITANQSSFLQVKGALVICPYFDPRICCALESAKRFTDLKVFLLCLARGWFLGREITLAMADKRVFILHLVSEFSQVFQIMGDMIIANLEWRRLDQRARKP